MVFYLYHLIFLFFDYLICDKDEFITDFKITSPKLLENNISEVKHRDQYAVVTGANSGIGFEISKILESRYHMVLIDKETGNLDLLNSETVNICVDLSDRDELRRSLSNINLNRQISLLINNAGVGFKENFVDTEMRKDLLTADVNVIAPIILSHHFKNELINTKGTIVNISSSVGHFPLPHMASYSASKSFISFWSQGVEEELRGRVNVVTFSPCGTRTGFQKRAGVKVSSDLMDPSKVAEEIFFSILKGKSVFKVLGSKSKVLIIIMTVLPRVIGINLVAKLFQVNR
jgi:short-subunit dehydrogenase